MKKKTDFILIGACVLDVLAQPVTTEVFTAGSTAASHISIHTGGDALNEAGVLAALGASVRLIGKIGLDMAGSFIKKSCLQAQIDTSFLLEEAGLETGVNIVFIDPFGERHFITSANGSLRRLLPEEVPGNALQMGRYLCFASIFVFPAFGQAALVELFAKAHAAGLIVCADMTKCKHGECLRDLEGCLALLDFIFPNYEEAALLTGLTGLDEIADAFLCRGVGCIVIKTGANGCFLKTRQERYEAPAYPYARCLDTTGAGDTFTACFLYAHSQGMPLAECAKFANAGASLCIEQIGAAGIPSAQQVWERYKIP